MVNLTLLSFFLVVFFSFPIYCLYLQWSLWFSYLPCPFPVMPTIVAAFLVFLTTFPFPVYVTSTWSCKLTILVMSLVTAVAAAAIIFAYLFTSYWSSANQTFYLLRHSLIVVSLCPSLAITQLKSVLANIRKAPANEESFRKLSCCCLEWLDLLINFYSCCSILDCVCITWLHHVLKLLLLFSLCIFTN